MVTKIKSLYGDIKGLLSQIPQPDKNSIVSSFLVKRFNGALDRLTQNANTDYSDYKVPESEEEEDWPGSYPTSLVRAQMGSVICRLEEEYGFGKNNFVGNPSIVIFNKNENDISIKINYSITDLVQKTANEEGKEKLRQLGDELSKTNKSWDTIKGILVWILNFSKDLFLEVIPLILKSNQ